MSRPPDRHGDWVLNSQAGYGGPSIFVPPELARCPGLRGSAAPELLRAEA